MHETYPSKSSAALTDRRWRRIGRCLISVLVAVTWPAIAAHGQQPHELPRARAWASGGFGITSTGGGIVRLGVAASLGVAMVTMRHQGFGTGYDDERTGTDVAALVGLRTR